MATSNVTVVPVAVVAAVAVAVTVYDCGDYGEDFFTIKPSWCS